MSQSQGGRENAITRRLDLVTERYAEFRADDDARLLRLLADAGDAKLLEVWLEVEDTEGGRFWLFREGLYLADAAMPRWYLHGLFA